MDMDFEGRVLMMIAYFFVIFGLPILAIIMRSGK